MGNKSFTFFFSDVEVREREFSLIRAGEVFPVEPKAFRVLLMLLRNPQKLITKEELLSAGWGDTAVTDNSLARSIALLRRLLDEDTRAPRFIETVSTVGYRFVCPVESVEDLSLNSNSEYPPARGIAQPVAQTSAYVKRSSWLLVGAIAALGSVAAGIWYVRRPLPAPHISEYTQLTRDGQRKILGGTDGSRIYFTHSNTNYFATWNTKSIDQVPIAGGQIAKIPIALKDPWLRDVSPDGSSLLIESPDGLWSIGVLGDSMRHLANGVEGAWSPDGKSVVYTDSTGDIYVVQSDGSNLHQLNASNGPSPSRLTFDLSWSPDGTRIRFTRNRELWEMSASGSNLRQLIPNWRPTAWKCCGRWTPDGAFFIFLSTKTEVVPASGPAELWAIDERREGLHPPVAEPVLLSSGPMLWGSPIPARDGKKIFAPGFVQRGELVRWNAQSHQMQPYLGGISAEYVAFSKDGKSVAYTTYPDGILWKSNIDGSGQVELTQPPFYPKLPRWSPDGTQILFNDGSSNGQLVMYVVATQGGAPKRLLPEDNGPEMDPNWSPDGKKVVFSTFAPFAGRADYSSKVELRLLDLATHTVSVVPGSDKISSPRWSPDGKFIVGFSDKNDVRVFELKTQRWTKLADGPVHWLTLSRDSQFVYFLDSSNDVSRVSIKGGRVERIIDLTGFSHTGWMGDWMSLDPGDAPLLLHNVGTEDLYALTLDRK